MTKIRFLHAADLHLDTPFKGITHFPVEQLSQLRNSTFQAFSNFIQYALREKPDFIVIVGDIYDGENRSLRAQLAFQEGMEALEEAKINVFLSYGNHDHLQGNWTRFELPDNVVVFNEEVEQHSLTIRGEKVTLCGFSYPKRHITTRMIDQYPVATKNHIHIGLLHGSVEGDQSHAVYAPFTKEALLSKHYDYWALGHIHKRQSLHEQPPIVYPGNIQGRHRNERGEKGFYDVTIEKESISRKFIPTSTIVFEELSVSCRNLHHAGDLFTRCKESLTLLQAQSNCALIVALTMVDIDEKTAELLKQSTEQEWLETLQEMMVKHVPFIWVNKITYVSDFYENDAVESFIKPLMATINQWSSEQWEYKLQDLYQHTRGIRYLDRLTGEDYEDIQSEVKKNLIEALRKRR